ncbi:MAG: SRPBCC family protein [Cyanobacteria bacterium SZAS-4]|nr:SRPBCC family protein [Cyanobacteria bacterium SZAS-4]
MKLHPPYTKAVLCLIASVTLSGTDFCLAKQSKTAANVDSAPPAQAAESKENEEKKKHLARSVSCFEIACPREVVWQTLTNFPKYPDLFKRVKTCRVTKREGDIVFLESVMKSQLFIKPTQHTVNDLTKGPGTLKWKLLDGNFKSVEGEWSLEPVKDGTHTKVTYAIEVEPGIVPQGIVAMFLKAIQKEAVVSLTAVSESYFAEHHAANEHASNNKG